MIFKIFGRTKRLEEEIKFLRLKQRDFEIAHFKLSDLVSEIEKTISAISQTLEFMPEMKERLETLEQAITDADTLERAKADEQQIRAISDGINNILLYSGSSNFKRGD